jgi:hypothetical protein
MKIRTDEELLALIEKRLDISCNHLWDDLEPEERKKVFTTLILEYLESTF